MARDLTRIAVLNRGEAATRCLRAIRELREEEGSGLVGIAFYTEPDQFAPFVREADESIDLGPALRGAPGAERPAYLDQDRVLAALRASRADGVWPGWGFLAEDPSFVERLEAAGLVFLGPSAATMRMLGDKMTSKRMAEAASVPVLPWSGGPVGPEDVERHAEAIGFPLMLKATAGGGGRGIRVIDRPEQLGRALESARAEAEHAFGDGTLFVEACVKTARHVEVQLAADRHGGVLALGLRDCSVQRRHQKVVEEGPPPGLSEATLSRMRECSVRLLREAGYVGVATAEFLVTPDEEFYFLEVNPRLQVEHGVTELLTGVDLVKWQIRIARGEAIPAEAPAERGHAIEVRVCAEDPAAGFAPSPGSIELLELPAGPGVRVDCGIASHGQIPSEFDSMVAKILAHGGTREEARTRLMRALSDLHLVVRGGTVNKGFLLDVLGSPAFRAGGVHTGWLDGAGLAREPDPRAEVLAVAAVLSYERERASVRANFFAQAASGRPRQTPASTGREVDVVYGGQPYRLVVYAIGGWTYRVHSGERVVQVRLLEEARGVRRLLIGDRRHVVLFSASDLDFRIELDGRQHHVQCDLGGKVRAPAPALVIEVAVAPGDEVTAGQRLGLLEAMKTETAFFAPLAGTVREVVARPGERVVGGDVLLLIEPSADRDRASVSSPLELPQISDPLDAFLDAAGEPSLGVAAEEPAGVLAEAVGVLRSESRRILTGYDVNPERADRLVQTLESSLGAASSTLRSELAQLSRLVELFADTEALFSRSPTRVEGEEDGPSNEARMAMYLRRMEAGGAGIAQPFLDELSRVLRHYEIGSLAPSDPLRRAILRLHATRTTLDLRVRLVAALLKLLVQLGEQGERFARHPELEDVLDHLSLMRGNAVRGISDLAAQAGYALFERHRYPDDGQPAPQVDFSLTVVPPLDTLGVAVRARELGLAPEIVRRFELWRLDNFELTRVPSPPGLLAFHGLARDGSGDERLFGFAEVSDLGPNVPARPDRAAFERSFREAIENMRSIQQVKDPGYRLHWNRLYVFIRPPILLSEELVSQTVRRLAPETAHLGLEKVIVRIASLPSGEPGAPISLLEVMTGNPTGGRVESTIREPHQVPLAPATVYERRVARARARGLYYPYETIRLFTALPSRRAEGPGGATGPGSFLEYDLVSGEARPVDRPPGGNTCGIVFGTITTPTAKYPEGMRRVLVLGDPSHGMGALAGPECDRIVAALDLAERLRLPLEWVAVSSGAKIAMDSGTENLDATARVVKKLVEFTDAGGEVNLILPGVNVGAQSYFDALATMGLHTRGILIMLPGASMVLTGRLALEFSGGVAAEDEVGIGGYERIMGPNGAAQYRARDLAGAFAILLDHYAVSYVAPDEPAPRRFASSDPADRDITLSPYPEEEFETIGDVFSAEHNPDRRRPFAMRPLMRALADRDAPASERWRDWSGAETAIVWETHLGGYPITLVGIESRPVGRIGHVPPDGPDTWTAGTLFPKSSKKVSRALNGASGVRPAVVLANLSGFDGSPESMSRGILEFGAEIARAVVRFRGPLLFCVVSRYHGGAYVVFSRELNPELRASALQGSFASVIGGPAAAAVVFPREVRERAQEDPRVKTAAARVDAATDATTRAALRVELERVLEEAILETRSALAGEFDAIHSVERALEVGSLEALIAPGELRATLIRQLGGAAPGGPGE